MVDGVVVVLTGVNVVVVSETNEIVFVDDLAGRFFVFAIFNVKTQAPVKPITNLVGLFLGVNEHDPFFDQDFIPEEFVETKADKFFTWPDAREETFHVTFVEGAADTELL